jgi:hypothetical protein
VLQQLCWGLMETLRTFGLWVLVNTWCACEHMV